MIELIQLPELLQEMDQFDADGQPIPFSIKFVTANKTTGKGGEIIEIESCTKCVRKDNAGNVIVDTRINDGQAKQRKCPNHYDNNTRNLLLPNGQIRKCHIRLIVEFNGRKVYY